MKAILLAAGKGSRLGARTKKTPKPMLEVKGKPVLEHLIALCRRHGVRDLFVNLHHRPEAITARLGDGRAFGVRIRYRRERRLLGTAGAVRAFAPRLGRAPFLVLYGDNLMDYDLGALMKAHVRSGADMSVAVFRQKDVRRSGVLTFDARGRVTSFLEKPKFGRPGWVNAGAYAVSPRVLKTIPRGFSDFGRDVIPALLTKGFDVRALKQRKPVIAIDTPALLRKARRSFDRVKR